MILQYILVLFYLSSFVRCSPVSSASNVHRFKRTAESPAPTSVSAEGQNTVSRVGRVFPDRGRTKEDGAPYHIINLSSLFTKFLPYNDRMKTNKETTQQQHECHRKYNGTVVNGECYQLQTELKDFFAATHDCIIRGGELWTPHLNDLELFNKLMTAMPLLAFAEREAVWINVFRRQYHFYDVNGQNLTSAYILQIDENEDLDADENCIELKASKGAFYVKRPLVDCGTTANFYVCEYELQNQLKIEIDKPEFPNLKSWFSHHSK